jgi:hypothetical protein
MTEITCKFCNNFFLNKYILDKHQKTAKFCLILQEKTIEHLETSFKCEHCNKNFLRKHSYENHKEICKQKNSKIINNQVTEITKLQNENKNNKKSIDKLKIELKIKNDFINELEIKNRHYENETKELYCKQIKNEIDIKNKDEIIDEFKIRINKLENELKEFYQNQLKEKEQLSAYMNQISLKAIENTGIKNTTINNKNQIYNALQPLTDEHMKEQTKNLTYQNVKNGAHGIAHFASNFTFKERVMCTDKSRLNFVFKNENDLIIKDPEGVEITKRFIDINRDEILRLVEIYLSCITAELMDDATSGEMYKFWAEKREEFIAIRSAVMKGNVSDNKESYEEFKKNFLQALSNLVPR